MKKTQDFLLIGAQEPMKTRLRHNSNVFKGIPPYFMPYGRDFIKTSQKAYNFPAYAIPILAAALKKKKFSVSCINDFYSENPDEVAAKIQNTRRAVGISTTFLTNKQSMINTARFIRKIKPSLKIIMGGTGIINFPEARRYADISAFFEGEETIGEVASALLEGGDISRVKGISYFDGRKERFTQKRDCMGDLGEVPMPDWGAVSDKVNQEKYLPIESSRGCIGNCSFCLETKYWPGVRFYTVDRVVREIKENINKFGIRFYYFQDSNISNSRAYLGRLTEAFQKERLKIKWSCESRIDTLTKELVGKMFKAGCRAITFGMESADERVLRNMNKAVSPDKMRSFLSIVKYMRAEGMLANINVILGFPGETKKSMEKTINFLLEAKPLAYSMSKFFLEKGTDIWKNRRKFDLKGNMYRWKHGSMESNRLDAVLRYMFLRVSGNLEIYHWTSASLDLIRHMGKGKSFDSFTKYLKSINQMCVEDLSRKKDGYSHRYDESLRYITKYLIGR